MEESTNVPNVCDDILSLRIRKLQLSCIHSDDVNVVYMIETMLVSENK